MAAKITFFPVGNGDMTLITLGDPEETRILVDINIQNDSDNNQMPCDVPKELRKRLGKDKEGRPYIDAFLLSHPDEDHCRGLQKHFHLGPLEEYVFEPPEGEEQKKIVIREMWSSPMIFRRAIRNHSLSEEAKAFNKEARRRVKVFRDKKGQDIEEGDRMIIIGEDEDGKTDDLQKILVNTGDTFSKINGKYNNFIKITILGPFPKQEDEEAEELLTKNDSSVIARFIITSDLLHPEACQFLTGGDAGVDIWEKIWSEYENNLITLQYDILLAPHHCSWHVLSHDSWSDCPDPQVSQEAKAALSQAKDGAFIISSSNPISDKTADPPCVGAKGEYESIVQDKDNFICTCEYPSEKNPEPLEFFISAEGPQRSPKKKGPYITMGGIGATREPLPHG